MSAGEREHAGAGGAGSGEAASFATLQVHAGQVPDPTSGARAVPIYATAGYAFDSAEHAAAVFAGERQGNQYGRMHNPTVQVLADRVSALEGGKGGLAVSSGQAATTAALLTLARPGAELIVSRELFGGTFAVARKILEPWGMRIRAVAPTAEAVADALSPDTVGVWVETIANPSGTVPDLPRLAEAAHAAGVPLLVDNTCGCSGYLCRPFLHGADVVVHSATKWINGHGTALAGVLVDAGTFDWDSPRFPAFRTLDARGRSVLDRGGELAFLTRAFDLGLFTMGMTLSPYAAFLALQGLETLDLRVERACATALTLAGWLERHPATCAVLYPGLPSHPSHGVAMRLLQGGYGAVVSFEVADAGAARTVLDELRLVSRVANLGESRTLAVHPWTTTHASLSEDARRAAGISPALIRLAVGLEGVDDLRRDLGRALEAALP